MCGGFKAPGYDACISFCFFVCSEISPLPGLKFARASANSLYSYRGSATGSSETWIGIYCSGICCWDPCQGFISVVTLRRRSPIRSTACPSQYLDADWSEAHRLVKSSEAGPRQYAPPRTSPRPPAPKGASNDRQHPLLPALCSKWCARAWLACLRARSKGRGVV